jgi:hypothetical protein
MSWSVPIRLEGHDHDMRYVLFMYADPNRTKEMTPDERAQIADQHQTIRAELIVRGELLRRAGLVYPEQTTTSPSGWNRDNRTLGTG